MIRWFMLYAAAMFAAVAADASHASAGEADATFGAGGTVRIELGVGVSQAVLVGRSAGRFIDVGTVLESTGFGGVFNCVSGILAGFNADGSLDVSFGNSGIVAAGNLVPNPIDALAGRCLQAAVAQRDGNVVVFGSERSGSGPSSVFAIRLSESGQADTTFGTAGYAVVDTGVAPGPVSAVLQNDGKSVVAIAGSLTGFTVVRLNTDGSRDGTFGSNGKVFLPVAESSFPSDPTALALQRDGKIVVGGIRTDLTQQTVRQIVRLARLLSDGSVDTSFGQDGVVDVEFAGHSAVFASLAIQSDGKIVVGAALGLDSSFALARYFPNGTLDPSFGNAGFVATSFPGYTEPSLRALEITPGGKLIAAGWVVKRPEGAKGAVARYNSDGSLDPAFGPNGDGRVVMSATEVVGAMLLEPDGSLVLADDLIGDIRLQKLTGDDAFDVVEFYNASLDHYFMSAEVQEIHDLDFGYHKGWTRTGLGFKAYPRNFGNAAVARLYIPPPLGDSHFFTSDDAELKQIEAKMLDDPNYQGYVVEARQVFRVFRPDPLTGACRANSAPMFRLWNQRSDSNHRYTTSNAMRLEMIARGYVPEGIGSPPVVMCVPAAQ